MLHSKQKQPSYPDVIIVQDEICMSLNHVMDDKVVKLSRIQNLHRRLRRVRLMDSHGLLAKVTS